MKSLPEMPQADKSPSTTFDFHIDLLHGQLVDSLAMPLRKKYIVVCGMCENEGIAPFDADTMQEAYALLVKHAERTHPDKLDWLWEPLQMTYYARPKE